MVGPLAHLLKNRFYVGEVAYRGEVHPGEHPPIVDRPLFEAVQDRLKEKAVTRRTLRTQSPAFLMGLLYDDRGNRMSPSHANKKGVRYRYYVSQAFLQKRQSEAGAICRISAPEIEGLVAAAVRHQASTINGRDSLNSLPSIELSDHELVTLQVERIVLRAKHVDITLRAHAPVVDEEDDLSALVASVPVMKPGDLWLLGEQRTLCGDALAPQSNTRLLGDEWAQTVFTGQPWKFRSPATCGGSAL
jgi:hypothetical protein